MTASEKSFNNELGVPLTLVNAHDDTDVAVIEMGARGAGHIAWLCDIARPTIGVVTAVELVHTELIGDLDAIARAKGELVEVAAGRRGGRAQRRRRPGGRHGRRAPTARSILYGVDHGEVRAADVALDPDLRARFRLESPWGSTDVHLGVRGLHHVANALAAAAVALLCDVPIDEVAAGLEVERALAVADGAAHRAERRPRAQRRLQRRPGVDGGGAAGAGPPRRRPPPRRARADGRAGRPRARPSTGASPRWPTSSGSSSSPSAPPTTASTPVPDVDAAARRRSGRSGPTTPCW